MENETGFNNVGFDDMEFDSMSFDDTSLGNKNSFGDELGNFDDMEFDNSEFGNEQSENNEFEDLDSMGEEEFEGIGNDDEFETEETFDDDQLSLGVDEEESEDTLAKDFEPLENESNQDLEFDDLDIMSTIKESPEESTEELSDEPLEEIEDTDAITDYSDGTIIDDIDLHDEEEEPESTHMGSDFINDAGGIVVQDDRDDDNGFSLEYINIENIAITQRIRKMHSVEGLVSSIKSTGLLRPLVVAATATEGLYVLLDGYRRIQACARAGKTRVPCIVNNRVNTPEIPILEAMYNHFENYTIKEQVDYITYLETQKGIMNPAMIEYLLQMNSGDYTKLKDILNDNDDDIITKLFDGAYDIATAFRKLEQRRKKESAEEKENKKAARVYEDEKESGADQIAGSGEETDGMTLTEEQIQSLSINIEDLDDDSDDTSLAEMIEEDKGLEGFEPHKQKPGEREYIDPIIKKSVMARDNNTCRCCKRGGTQYVDILDLHHVKPVYWGGVDSVENSVMLCVSCHRLVHLYSTDDLTIDKALLENSYDELSEEQKLRYENEQIFEDEKARFKRIIKLGSVIRKLMSANGMNKEQFKKEHSNAGIGRRKPGVNAEQEKA